MTKKVSALSEARYVSGITQSTLAEKMDVTTPTISRWEKDPDSVSVGTFFDLYRAMTPRGQAILDKFLDDKRIFFVT